MDTPFISIVIPIFKEEANVRPLSDRLSQVMEQVGLPWELVLALDPSPDATEERIRELIGEGRPIRLIKFSRRFGKPLSLLAGLDHCRGDACVIMDADLQDPPELIGEMVSRWRDGYKVVIAQRRSRKGENPVYLACASLFYRIVEKIGDVDVPRNTGDFRLLDARVVTEIRRCRERHGFLRGMTASVGFPTVLVPFDRDPRHAGRTQIHFLGALNIALDGIIPFSRTPLRLMAGFGGLIFFVAALFGVGSAIHGLIGGFSDLWWLQLVLCALVAMSGIVVGCLGVIGEYLVRTYEEVRSRPLYIVDEIVEYDASSAPGHSKQHPDRSYGDRRDGSSS